MIIYAIERMHLNSDSFRACIYLGCCNNDYVHLPLIAPHRMDKLQVRNSRRMHSQPCPFVKNWTVLFLSLNVRTTFDIIFLMLSNLINSSANSSKKETERKTNFDWISNKKKAILSKGRQMKRSKNVTWSKDDEWKLMDLIHDLLFDDFFFSFWISDFSP